MIVLLKGFLNERSNVLRSSKSARMLNTRERLRAASHYSNSKYDKFMFRLNRLSPEAVRCGRRLEPGNVNSHP